MLQYSPLRLIQPTILYPQYSPRVYFTQVIYLYAYTLWILTQSLTLRYSMFIN